MAKTKQTDHIGRLGNLANIIQLGQWAIRVAITVSAFALPAWAASAAGFMAQYAPLSWVATGFAGLFAAAVSFAIAGWGRGKWVRSIYDRRMIARGAYVDPMRATFERERIYLNDFVLPSNPFVEDRTFIDCELIGPANINMGPGNQHTDQRMPHCDAVLIRDDGAFFNGITFVRCTFRRCSFQRVTVFVPLSNYARGDKDVNWLNYITFGQEQGDLPFGAVNLTPQISSHASDAETDQQEDGENGGTKQ